MIRFARTFAAALALTQVCAAAAHAGSFDRALVGGKAKFVAFVDLDGARRSAVGARLIAYAREDSRVTDVEAQLAEHVGMTPLTDVHDLTLWVEAFGPQPKGVLVVRAKFDAKALRWAAGFTADFAADAYSGHELLSWKDDNRPGRVHACIVGPGKVLFSGDADTLRRGVDVVTDPVLSLAADATLPTPADQSVWAFAAAEGFDRTPDAQKNPVARQLADARLEFGQTDAGKTVLRAAAKTLTDDAAPRLLRMAVGAQMFAEMAADRPARPATAPADAPADPPAAARATVAKRVPALLKALRPAADGRVVSLTLTLDNDTALDLLQELIDVRDADVAAGD